MTKNVTSYIIMIDEYFEIQAKYLNTKSPYLLNQLKEKGKRVKAITKKFINEINQYNERDKNSLFSAENIREIKKG